LIDNSDEFFGGEKTHAMPFVDSCETVSYYKT